MLSSSKMLSVQTSHPPLPCVQNGRIIAVRALMYVGIIKKDKHFTLSHT